MVDGGETCDWVSDWVFYFLCLAGCRRTGRSDNVGVVWKNDDADCILEDCMAAGRGEKLSRGPNVLI
jgi:hypothetical protein